jgi:hypothetical protein
VSVETQTSTDAAFVVSGRPVDVIAWCAACQTVATASGWIVAALTALRTDTPGRTRFTGLQMEPQGMEV